MLLANSIGVGPMPFKDFMPYSDFTITIPFHSAYEPVIVRLLSWIVISFHMKRFLIIELRAVVKETDESPQVQNILSPCAIEKISI
jgi:hypothetical protein